MQEKSGRWIKKQRGWSTIYRHPQLQHSVVDRNGWGLASALGYQYTYKGDPYPTLKAAMKAAEDDIQSSST